MLTPTKFLWVVDNTQHKEATAGLANAGEGTAGSCLCVQSHSSSPNKPEWLMSPVLCTVVTGKQALCCCKWFIVGPAYACVIRRWLLSARRLEQALDTCNIPFYAVTVGTREGALEGALEGRAEGVWIDKTNGKGSEKWKMAKWKETRSRAIQFRSNEFAICWQLTGESTGTIKVHARVCPA